MSESPKRSGLLRVHAWLILIAVAVTIGSAAAVALTRQSSYVAMAQVLVGPEQAGGTALRPEMGSEREIATSGTVTARAADVLGGDPAHVKDGLAVSAVVESSVLDIRYTAPTGEAAAAGATAFAQAYVDYRNSVAGTRLTRVVTSPETVARSGVNLTLILAVALVAGLFLGVAAAWLWDRVADRVHHSQELTDLSGLPVLGEIPRWRAPDQLAPAGAARESFDYLASRLSLTVSNQGLDLRIVVTSPRAGAGATTVALNLALSLAAAQREVVLVSVDSNRPALHEPLDLPQSPGLSEVLRGECGLESALRHTQRPHLSVLTVGGPPDSDASKWHPEALSRVLDDLRTRAIVVVDAPPILETADSLVLVDEADVLLLVGGLRSARRRDVEQAMRVIDESRPALAWWITNLPRRVSSGSDRPKAEPRAVAAYGPAAASRSPHAAS